MGSVCFVFFIMKDSLLKIKKEEESLEDQITEFKKELERRKEERTTLLKENLSDLKKEHQKKRENLEKELEPVFRGIDKEYYTAHLQKMNDLKVKAKKNFERFFDELKKRIK